MRTHALATVLALSIVALGGCPIDGSGGGGGATGSPNLTPTAKVGDLSPADLSVLCSRNLSSLQNVNSTQAVCTVEAAFKTEDEAACGVARDACVSEHADDPAEKCQMLNGKIDCSATVQEIESCIQSLSTWASGITCAMAGKAPDQPSCAQELETTCKGLDALYSDKAPPPAVDDEDAGVEPGAREDAGSMEPGETVDAGGTVDPGEDTCTAEGYDLGAGVACNTCATAACCESYVACRADVGCDCFWECLEVGGVDCAFECGIATEYPDQFLAHSTCLAASCEVECGLAQ